jgi:hypothetical protein
MRGDAEVHQLDRAILEERAKIGDGAAHAELAREGVRALAVRRCDGDQLNVDAAHVVIGLGMEAGHEPRTHHPHSQTPTVRHARSSGG